MMAVLCVAGVDLFSASNGRFVVSGVFRLFFLGRREWPTKASPARTPAKAPSILVDKEGLYFRVNALTHHPQAERAAHQPFDFRFQ